MEVLCERCHTEYDFDDALVSERGTTVKCTTCGHQFRIHRPKETPATPERWLVRTQNSQELVYTSLRDLQRAIARGRVGRDDTLVREGIESRSLSSIAELDPFFPQLRAPEAPRLASEPPRSRQITPKGMGMGVANLFRDSEDPPTRRMISAPPPPVAPNADPPEVEEEATVPRMELSDFSPPKLPVPSSPKPSSSMRVNSLSSPRSPKPPPEEDSKALPKDVSRLKTPSESVEVPNRVVIREAEDLSLTPTPSDIRMSYPSSSDEVTGPRFVPMAPKRSSAMRWMVAVVVLGGVAVLGATVGRNYLVRVQAPSPAVSADARIVDLLRRGERELLDGDLEGAKESFDKASILADNDPKVMVQLARLANARADQSWLRLKILPPDAADAVASVKRELEERASRAQQAAERAAVALPGDPDASRARIDAYRLIGDLPLARRLVPQVSQRQSEPETAYILAALEMGESQPNWGTVVERLKIAASAEQNLGRARAALVVALASSGQLDLANLEFEALSKLTRRHPLLSELKAYLSRGGKAADAGPISSVATLDAGAPTAAAAAGGGDLAASEGGSYQDLLRRARDAQKAGDMARAEALYRAVLAKNPQETEALGGLGDLARERGDKGASLRYYEEVTKQNPGYLPALIGMADAKWDSGDKAGATALYRQVLERVGGQGPYAAKARQRISASQSGGSAASSTGSPAAPATTVAPAASGSKPAAPAGADTSDLPGWKP